MCITRGVISSRQDACVANVCRTARLSGDDTLVHAQELTGFDISGFRWWEIRGSDAVVDVPQSYLQLVDEFMQVVANQCAALGRLGLPLTHACLLLAAGLMQTMVD